MSNKISFPLCLCLLAFIHSAGAIAATALVNIQNSAFVPADIVISIGDTVKWTNKDVVPHTATSVTVAGQTTQWDSGLLSQNQAFEFTFDKPGVFNYKCNVHLFMQGKVTVLTPEQMRIFIGKKIISGTPSVLPIKLNFGSEEPRKVYKGSYIVNAQGACADCHSCPTYKPGNNPYKGERKQFNTTGYLAGGVGFGPVAVSRNLTPVVAGRPAGLTLAQFKAALRTGHSPHIPRANVLQVMPWPVYGMMSDEDIEAVYSYLKTIPAATAPTTLCPGPGQ